MSFSSPANILLVDSQPENDLALELILNQLGQNFVLARSPEQASAFLQQQSFALILLAIPPLIEEGFATARAIQKNQPAQAVPMIFLGNSPNQELINQSYTLGAVDYLVFPINPIVLTAKIKVFIKLFQQNTAQEQAATCAQTQIVELHRALNTEIAERQRLEAVLQESEERFQALSEAILEAIVIHERGIVLEANAAFAKMFGYESGEVLGMNARDFLTPESVELLFQQIAIAYEKSYEMVGIKKDGTLFSLEVTGKNIWYQGRQVRVASVWDMTERKQRETALQQSEERLRLAMLNAPLPIMIHAEDGEILHISKAWTDLTGYDPEEITTISAWVACGHRHHQPFMESYIPSLYDLQERLDEGDFTIMTRSGELRTWSFRSAPLGETVDGRRLLIAMAIDITERQRREKQLHLLESVVVNANDAVLITSAEAKDQFGGEIIYTNQAFTQITGYSPEEVLGKTPKFLYGEKTNCTALTEISRAWQTHQPVRVELVQYRRDGSKFWVELSAIPITNEEGDLTHWVTVERNISRRKQAEIVQAQLIESLQESQRLVQQITDTTPNLIYIFDIIQKRNLYANQRCCEFFGFGLNAIQMGEDFFAQAMHPEDSFKLNELPAKFALAQDGEIIENEFRMRNAQGEWRWLHSWEVIFLRNQAGEPIQILGTAVDVTERQRAEVALQKAKDELEIKVAERTVELKQSNQQLQTELLERARAQLRLQEQAQLLDLAHDAITVCTLDHTITFWNRGAEEIYGFTAAEALGKKYSDLLQTQFFQPLPKITAELLGSGRWEGELQQIKRDGKPIIVASRWALQRDAYGTPLKILKIKNNITERKFAEAALRESEERFRSAFDYATIGMALVGLDGGWLKVNHSLCEIVGYSEAELLGTTFQAIAHSDDLDAAFQCAAQLLSGEIRSYQMEQRYFHKSGHIVWILSSGSLIRDLDNSPLYFIAQIQDITDRKLAEQERDRFFNLSIDILGVAKLGGEIKQLNPAWEKILGFSVEKSQGKFFQEFMHLEDLPAVSLACERLFTGEAIIDLENRCLCLDGSYKWLSWTIIPFLQEGLIYCFARDITERKQVEAERAKLIAILEATSDFVSSADLDGQVFYFNKAARKTLGIEHREGFGTLKIPESHPNWAAELIQNEGIPTAIREGSWMGETAMISYEGREIPLSQLIIAHKSADGNVNMISSVARDITQQKQIEATLRESERRWRSLLDHVRLVVVGLDREYQVDYANPFFLELVGYSSEEVIGKDWLETFLPHHQRRREQNSFQELLGQKFSSHSQNLVITKSGEEKLIAWNHTLLKDLQGNAIGILSIGEDITERQAIERMKSEFVSVVSHELRTPLTSIHGALNLLSSGLVDPQTEKGKRVIEIAADNAERLARLVNDILELERLESGKISLSKQPCNVAEAIAKVVDLMQVMASRMGISLMAVAPAIEVEADSDRLIQVLTNLIGNAIKFSPKNSTVWLKVESQSSESGPPSIKFIIRDQGRGIPADKLESIFERFQQVDASDSRKKGGTGLGLAICRSIVQQHGGQIWAESIVGEGSCFYFTLPL